jgi:hypothetical protein
MKMTLLLVAAGLAMTVCGSQGGDPDSTAPTRSDTGPATKLVVAFTGNRWTTDKLLIATGTLTNTNPMPVMITDITATGFDKHQELVAGGPGALEEVDYTIGDAEIGPGATAIFKVAFRDPKKAIRFVKATPLIEPIPTPTPIGVATPIPAVEAPATAAVPTPTAAIHATVEELALAAWQKDKMLPGKDGQYNWFEIGLHESDWETFFHSKGLLLPADDKAFGAALSAIAHRSEERLRERAFQNSQ